MRIGDRYELAAELAGRYWKGSRQERGAILDAFCLATGYHRNYVIEVLRGRRRVAVRQRVARPGAMARSSRRPCWWPGRPRATSTPR